MEYYRVTVWKDSVQLHHRLLRNHFHHGVQLSLNVGR